MTRLRAIATRGCTRAAGLARLAGLVMLAAGLVATDLVATGCESRDPNRALSTGEQATLLRDIRKSPSRLQDLTPAERAFLLKRAGR